MFISNQIFSIPVSGNTLMTCHIGRYWCEIYRKISQHCNNKTFAEYDLAIPVPDSVSLSGDGLVEFWYYEFFADLKVEEIVRDVEFFEKFWIQTVMKTGWVVSWKLLQNGHVSALVPRHSLYHPTAAKANGRGPLRSWCTLPSHVMSHCL